MSARNSPAAKAARRVQRAQLAEAQPRHAATGICRACGDPRYRTLIRPERICVPCFDRLISGLATLHRVFG